MRCFANAFGSRGVVVSLEVGMLVWMVVTEHGCEVCEVHWWRVVVDGGVCHWWVVME